MNKVILWTVTDIFKRQYPYSIKWHTVHYCIDKTGMFLYSFDTYQSCKVARVLEKHEHIEFIL